MKKFLVIILALFMLVSMTACGKAPAGEPVAEPEKPADVAYNTEVEPFRVAVFIALTGANANSAVFQIQAAIATLSKLQCPALTTSQADSIFDQGCDYIYGIAQVSSKAAAVTTQFVSYLAEKYGVDTSRIGCVAVDNDYGRMNMETFEKRYSAMDGYELIYSEAYPADTADMSSIVTALKNKDVQLLHSINLDQDGKLFFATIKGMNYNPLVIGGGSGIMYPTFIEACGPVLEGVLSGTHTNPNASNTEDDEMFQELKAMCYDKYGHYGGEFLVSYYSQMQVLHQLLNETKSYDRQVNNKAMKELEFHTLFPKIDADGNYTDIQYFDEKGTSPNSTTEMAQFQYDANGELWPTCVYPEALASAEIQWNR